MTKDGLVLAMNGKSARVLFCMLLLLPCSGAFAADLPVTPAKPPAAASAPVTEVPPETEANVFAAPDANCVAWTDGCRICRRTDDGKASCSNIGMACQPEQISCQQR